MPRLLLFIFILNSFPGFGQDTVRIMHYNLLMYGNSFGSCNSSNNNINDKNGFLNTIVNYYEPDIITVNEIDENQYYHEFLLDEALNTNGVSKYSMINLPNYGDSPIMNEIYFNTEKFEPVLNAAIQTNYRDIDLVRFNYKDQPDNIVLNCIVGHLKAGNDFEDEIERANETNKLMNYLNNNNLSGNYIFAGDFNLYSGSEIAYQNLLFHQNPQIRFYDPIDQLGSWHNNQYYASIHTQSTHTSGNCFSGGGMDDRFDFILISDEIRDGKEKIKYVSNSYTVPGQDGLRFNQSLLFPANNSLPAEVLASLYDMSDHLPVIIDLAIGDNIGSAGTTKKIQPYTIKNPVNHFLEIGCNLVQSDRVIVHIYNTQGNLLLEQKINTSHNSQIKIPVNQMSTGLYIVSLFSDPGLPYRQKILIHNSN